MLYVDSQHAIKTHPLICHPGKQKKREEITPPVIEQYLESRHKENEQCYPMAKAIFASPDVAEFADPDTFCRFAFSLGKIAWFFEDLFLGHRPSNGGDYK